MKSIKITFLLTAILSFLILGCEKEYEDHYRVTFFPEIIMEGEKVVFSPKDGNYQDAGASSTENGEEIETIVTSTVDNSAIGSYSVTYSAVNVDGYAASLVRKVIVYDPNTNATDISGVYTGHVVRTHATLATREFTGNPVTLTKVEGMDGIYQITDWIAGFYDAGYGYGPDYRFVGYIQINSANEVVLLDMSNPWGDPFVSVVGTYDPATNKIDYVAKWLSYTFTIDLTKN